MELSNKLVNALLAIYENIPDLRRVVQQKVLDILSIVLQGSPYRHPGAPVVQYFLRSLSQFSDFSVQVREPKVLPKPRDHHRKSSARSTVDVVNMRKLGNWKCDDCFILSCFS